MCTTDFSVIWKTTLTELGKSPNCPHSQILPMTHWPSTNQHHPEMTLCSWHWPSTHQHHPEMTLCSWHTNLRPINIILRWHCAAERTKTPNYCFMTSDQFTISLTQHKTLNCTSTPSLFHISADCLYFFCCHGVFVMGSTVHRTSVLRHTRKTGPRVHHP